MFYWSESFTSLIRFWQPQFDGLTRLTLLRQIYATALRRTRDFTKFRRIVLISQTNALFVDFQYLFGVYVTDGTFHKSSP